MNKQSKATIYTTYRQRNKVMNYVRARGIDPVSTGRNSFEFVAYRGEAVMILTDLRYEFPRGYVSGWIEPVQDDTIKEG